MVQYAAELGMDTSWPDLAGIRKFEVEVDSATGRVRVNAEPHELDAAMAAVERIQETNLRQEEMIDLVNRRTAALIAEARTASAAQVGDAVAVTGTSAAQESPDDFTGIC